MHEAIRFLRQLQTSLLANNMLNTYVFKSWCHFIQMVSIATNIILEKKFWHLTCTKEVVQEKIYFIIFTHTSFDIYKSILILK